MRRDVCGILRRGRCWPLRRGWAAIASCISWFSSAADWPLVSTRLIGPSRVAVGVQGMVKCAVPWRSWGGRTGRRTMLPRCSRSPLSNLLSCAAGLFRNEPGFDGSGTGAMVTLLPTFGRIQLCPKAQACISRHTPRNHRATLAFRKKWGRAYRLV